MSDTEVIQERYDLAVERLRKISCEKIGDEEHFFHSAPAFCC